MTLGDAVTIAFPSGMLGAGIHADSIERALEQGAEAIVIDAGSTDSGPHYLGAAVSKSPAAAVKRDLRLLLRAARTADIPLIVSSCGTSGTDAGVDWTTAITTEIASEDGLSFRLARIYSEQDIVHVAALLSAGDVHPLPPAGDLDATTLAECVHVVGLMGHEPIAAALDAGADVILAGRATDTALVASVALHRRLPPGATWHAAKTVECGDLCTTRPHGDGVLVTIDSTGFTVTPLDPTARCTPASVAAHMLYENADPFRLIEPSGTLDTTDATYTAVDARAVRVEHSRFEASTQHTIKIEGSGLTGYETLSIVGIADPHVLRHLDAWTEDLSTHVRSRVKDTLGLNADAYDLQITRYGSDAVLGPLAVTDHVPNEVGIVFRVLAADQATATAIAKTANPLLLHLPLPDMTHLPSFAFLTSPAEIERGACYRFLLNHVIDVADPAQLFRTTIGEVPGA